MTSGRVLISGASIAGPTLAYWLARGGWDVTILERAETLRTGGQNIDVRGAGREVARRMGLEPAIRACTTGEVGTQFLDRAGRAVASFPAGTDDSGGATAELEILRGELSRLLFEATRDDVRYRFGTSVTSIDDRDRAALVATDDGTEAEYDVVVIAEGMRSRTRRLAFPGVSPVVYKGMYTAYATIPRIDSDIDWWRWYSATGGRSITLRPDNLGTTRATLSFPDREPELDRQNDGAVRALLHRVFNDAGWQARRVLDEIDRDADLYFDHVGQVKLDAWHRGRTVLVGDAAYCASPLSGMGTSLALTGAYVLAGELNTGSGVEGAFAAYEALMRPYVDKAQDLPPGTPRLANPRTRLGIAAFHTVLRAAGTAAGRRITSGLFRPPADQMELPMY
ncbi:2-polyprenyl-6-methoxyphenol hydroxylase-like FAD-dependent oxidoreductase [Microbacterium sp. SORGH_AS 888]|nr:2-polyprenyl-6-methoxyphenol hydroxylase-like FAD-dependent oxidoreductase [Microbacterium sp. SORGH_AS_0888]